RLRQIEGPIEPDVFRNGGSDQGLQIFEAQLAQHLRDLICIRADMTIGESGDRSWGRGEVIRSQFSCRFRDWFFYRLCPARMHCERLRSAMGASSEAVEAAALCGGRISLRLPLRTAAATPLRGEIRRLTRGMTSK